MLPSTSPTHTEVDSCFVNPVNHVCHESCVVPVLPAAGRPPSSPWPDAVPILSTFSMADTTVFATFSGSAFSSQLPPGSS
ncbi:hypothetical protein ISCU110981_15470 [Isoptericola cucumis]